MLIELPNGDFLTSDNVRRLYLVGVPHRGIEVCVQYPSGSELIDFPDVETAREWMRGFARQVNAARSGKTVLDGEAEPAPPRPNLIERPACPPS